MELKVHKGTHEIGGTCIALTGQETRILLDLGTPLSVASQPLDVRSLRADGLVISHPHQDHYGLIDELDESVPIFMSQLGKNLIDAVRMFLGKQPFCRDFRYFEAWQPFEVGRFKITPYLVDHSTPDAFAFLIEFGHTKVFYSGDFRAHGRKSKLFERIIEAPPAGIDVLLMEGTMLQRDNAEFPNEQAVENAILEVITNQTNMSFLVTSSQNIDRIVSAYRACMKAEPFSLPCLP